MLNLAKLERFTLVLIRDDRAAEKAPPIVAMFLHLEGREARAIRWWPTVGVFAPEADRYNPEHVLRRAGVKDITSPLREAHKAFVDSEIRIRDGCRAAHKQPCECQGCNTRGMR